MLVYGPGQFFVSHQDSEKGDDMIGTLVVILPSAFTGGAMVIEHHDEQVSFRAASGKLTFIAFYADCRHQVRPVTAGYRVVFTYNLMVARSPRSRYSRYASSRASNTPTPSSSHQHEDPSPSSASGLRVCRSAASNAPCASSQAPRASASRPRCTSVSGVRWSV